VDIFDVELTAAALAGRDVNRPRRFRNREGYVPASADGAHDPPQALLDRITNLGVEVVRWPPSRRERSTRRERDPTPRLYLVEQDAAAPARWGALEDWARLPASPTELLNRAKALLAKNDLLAAVVELDDLVLRVLGRSIILSSNEASLLRVLLDHPRQVVSNEDIVTAVWPGKDISEHGQAIHNPLRTLRQRLRGTPVRIHTLRGRGLLVDLQAEADQSSTGEDRFDGV